MKKKLLSFTTILLVANCIHAQIPNYVPSIGIVGWWPFNGNANDESGNGNNGVVSGATLSADRFGNLNSSYSFDNSYIDILNSSIASFGLNSFSASAWFKTSTNYNNVGDLIRYDNCLTGSGWGIMVEGPFVGLGLINAIEFPQSRVVNSTLSNTAYNDSQWHFVTFVRNVSTMTNLLYVDGALVAQTSFSTINLIENTGNPLRFGSCGTYSLFKGNIDDIGIWNRSLTACEIQTLYAAQISPNLISAGLDQSICSGENITLQGSGGTIYLWNNNVVDGQPFSPSFTNEYVLSGTDINGCLGFDTVVVNVFEHSSSVDNQTAVDSYTWPINGQTYNQSGSYTATILNNAGCDSTITLNLTLSFSATEELSNSTIELAPNPTSDFISLKVDEIVVGSKYFIFDNTGRLIIEGDVIDESLKVDLQNLTKGLYHFKLMRDQILFSSKIIKN